jgi:hypothetical protein
MPLTQEIHQGMFIFCIRKYVSDEMLYVCVCDLHSFVQKEIWCMVVSCRLNAFIMLSWTMVYGLPNNVNGYLRSLPTFS